MCLNDGFGSSVEHFFTLTAIGVVAALYPTSTDLWWRDTDSFKQVYIM